MDRISWPVLLQNQNTWTFRILGIFFNNCPVCYTFNDFSDLQVIFSQFIISMLRYQNLASFDKTVYLVEKITHLIFSNLIILSNRCITTCSPAGV